MQQLVSNLVSDIELADQETNHVRMTDWYPCTALPVHVGMYERHFIDSKTHRQEFLLHYWDGSFWLLEQNGTHCSKQMDGYPSWRGLTQRFEIGQEIVLIRGSRGRTTGPGCERKVRVRLDSIDPLGNVRCTLLEDDALATTNPTRAGESGNWNGLSFLSKS